MIIWGMMFSNKMKRDRVDAYSAQSAFYVLMSFIPFIMLLLTLLQYTPLTQEDLLNLLMEIFPDSFREVIIGMLEPLFTRSTALVSGTAITAVWASSKAVLAITRGLNAVHNVRETRNYYVMRVRSAFYIVVMLLALMLTMALMVFGNQIHEYLTVNFTFLQYISGLVICVRTIVTLVILTILFASLFTMLPNKRPDFFSQLPGAAAAAVSWSAFSFGFSIYLEYAHNMSAIYGSLTTIVIIMLWLYFCMWLLFVGVEINCYLEEPQTFHLTDDVNMIE